MQVLSAYLKFMTDIGALLAGARVNRTVIEQPMREVIAFEQAIAEVQKFRYYGYMALRLTQILLHDC